VPLHLFKEDGFVLTFCISALFGYPMNEWNLMMQKIIKKLNRFVRTMTLSAGLLLE
jgi:hypothetical protein